MSRKCEKHGLNQDLFCLGHNIAICARCTQSDHFKCPQFVPIEDAAKYARPLDQMNKTRHEPDTTVATSADILQTVRNEQNTFNNFVKAAIESGEENTFTKFLISTTTRSENDRIDEQMKFSNLQPKSPGFSMHENKQIAHDQKTTDDLEGDMDDPENSDAYFMRPKSAEIQSPRRSHHASPLRRSHDPSETPRSPKSAKGIKSDVGQLLEDVRNFSKGLSSRDDVGINITLDDLIMKIDRALHEIAENFQNTKAQKTAIESQIKDIRHRINKHLDNMENKLLDSLETKLRQCESNVSGTIQRLQKGKVDINNMKNGNSENSPFQQNTLLAIRESDKQFRRMKRSVNAMTENIYAIDMDVRINQDLLAFIGEIQTFGEVSINTRLNPKISDPVEPRRVEVIRTETKRTRPEEMKKLTPTRPVERLDSKKTRTVNKPKRTLSKRELVETTRQTEQVQPLPEIELGQNLAFIDEALPEIVVTSRSSISGIRIMQKKKVKIGHKWTASVTNCKMLPNGRLIFIDTENKRLVIHNKDTYVYRNLKVSDSPRDFAIIDSDRVAVTFGVYIEILNMSTCRKEKVIRLEFFECNGISYMDGKFYIYGIFDGYLLSRHGIQIMDMYGRVEDRLPITRVQTIHHSIATWKGRIYFTGYSSITCCTTSGEELWVFKHDLMDHPKSLTVDGYGNVFASYENENKIVLISVDGLHSKEFELRKHDLYYGQDPRPISVFFDLIESALIVCNANKDHSVMYFVKYD